MKDVNRYTSNEFHDWQRVALPGLVIQDLDAWAIVASDPGTFAPLALFELKRSTIPAQAWSPFPDDRRNYASLQALADLAGIPFVGVYWQAGKPIGPSTLFRVFMFETVMPEYRGRARLMRADVFADRFPFPFGEPLVGLKAVI